MRETINIFPVNISLFLNTVQHICHYIVAQIHKLEFISYNMKKT